MKVTVEGKYVIAARKIKELVNYEVDLIVPDGMTEGELKSFLKKSKDSPLIKKLKEDDKQFYALYKFRFLNFVQTLPKDEELDTPESLGIETKIEAKPSGKVTASHEFGDVTSSLAEKVKRKVSKKVTSGQEG